MLPAGQAADAAVRALVNSETDSVTFSPNRALCSGRLELAMPAEDLAFAADEQHGAIDGTACPFIELDDADDYVNPDIMGSFAQAFRGRARNFHGVCQIVRRSFGAA